MAVTKVLARGWTFEIQTDEATPTYVPIGGINNFSVSPTKNDADVTDFDSEGREEHLPASRGLSITVEGFYLEDPDTGERDPGQQAVEELADKIGVQGIAGFRMTSPGGNTKEFKASANVTSPGGGNNDPASWSAELTVSGKITSTPADGGGGVEG